MTEELMIHKHLREELFQEELFLRHQLQGQYKKAWYALVRMMKIDFPSMTINSGFLDVGFSVGPNFYLYHALTHMLDDVKAKDLPVEAGVERCSPVKLDMVFFAIGGKRTGVELGYHVREDCLVAKRGEELLKWLTKNL